MIRETFYTFILTALAFTNAAETTEEKDPHLTRLRRGLLSRTGECPNPMMNYKVKEDRLDMYGRAHIVRYLTPNKKRWCDVDGCSEHWDCEGNHRCCRNKCGAMVCTPARRDLHPCAGFPCPEGQRCNVRRVKCLHPRCPDMWARSAPLCVPDHKAKGYTAQRVNIWKN